MGQKGWVKYAGPKRGWATKAWQKRLGKKRGYGLEAFSNLKEKDSEF